MKKTNKVLTVEHIQPFNSQLLYPKQTIQPPAASSQSSFDNFNMSSTRKLPMAQLALKKAPTLQRKLNLPQDSKNSPLVPLTDACVAQAQGQGQQINPYEFLDALNNDTRPVPCTGSVAMRELSKYEQFISQNRDKMDKLVDSFYKSLSSYPDMFPTPLNTNITPQQQKQPEAIATVAPKIMSPQERLKRKRQRLIAKKNQEIEMWNQFVQQEEEDSEQESESEEESQSEEEPEQKQHQKKQPEKKQSQKEPKKKQHQQVDQQKESVISQDSRFFNADSQEEIWSDFSETSEQLTPSQQDSRWRESSSDEYDEEYERSNQSQNQSQESENQSEEIQNESQESQKQSEQQKNSVLQKRSSENSASQEIESLNSKQNSSSVYEQIDAKAQKSANSQSPSSNSFIACQVVLEDQKKMSDDLLNNLKNLRMEAQSELQEKPQINQIDKVLSNNQVIKTATNQDIQKELEEAKKLIKQQEEENKDLKKTYENKLNQMEEKKIKLETEIIKARKELVCLERQLQKAQEKNTSVVAEKTKKLEQALDKLNKFSRDDQKKSYFSDKTAQKKMKELENQNKVKDQQIRRLKDEKKQYEKYMALNFVIFNQKHEKEIKLAEEYERKHDEDNQNNFHKLKFIEINRENEKLKLELEEKNSYLIKMREQYAEYLSNEGEAAKMNKQKIRQLQKKIFGKQKTLLKQIPVYLEHQH